MFVLAHLMQAKIPLTHIVGGVVFALAYEVKGYLLAPISIHILGNMRIYLLNITYKITCLNFVLDSVTMWL